MWVDSIYMSTSCRLYYCYVGKFIFANTSTKSTTLQALPIFPDLRLEDTKIDTICRPRFSFLSSFALFFFFSPGFLFSSFNFSNFQLSFSTLASPFIHFRMSFSKAEHTQRVRCNFVFRPFLGKNAAPAAWIFTSWDLRLLITTISFCTLSIIFSISAHWRFFTRKKWHEFFNYFPL